MNNAMTQTNQPSAAYRYASYTTFFVGGCGFLMGLWNAQILLSEKGFYLAIFLLGLFSAVTLQKTVRDKQEGLAVNKMFTAICWSSFFSAIALLAIGLYNAEMLLSEKGFYAMAFVVSLFVAITIQKNTRDISVEANETSSAEVLEQSSDLTE